MQTKARVIALEGDFAMVEAERSSACEGCHKAQEGGCSVCSLMGGERKLATRAHNALGARLGDTVLIESNDGRMLWYALLVFVLPILIALFSWGIVSLLTQSTVWQIAGGAFGFCATFFCIYVYSKMISKKRCDVEIVEILKQEE